MRTDRSVFILFGLLGLATLGLSACGAQHPFKRGESRGNKTTLASTGAGGSSDAVTKPGTDGGDPGTPAGPSAARVYFGNEVFSRLSASCVGCHKGMGEPFDLAQDEATDYVASKAKIVPGKPDESIIYRKAKGLDGHAGGDVWSEGSADLAAAKAWIEQEEP